MMTKGSRHLARIARSLLGRRPRDRQFASRLAEVDRPIARTAKRCLSFAKVVETDGNAENVGSKPYFACDVVRKAAEAREQWAVATPGQDELPETIPQHFS